MYAGVPTQVPVLVSVASACLPLESCSVAAPSLRDVAGLAAELVVAAAAWRAMPKSTTRGAAVLVEQHVVGLEVAVDEAGRVRGREAAPRRDEHVEDLAPRPRLVGEPALDRPAGDELHRQEHLVLEHADVVHGDDVRVLQPRDRLRLAQQARARRVLRAALPRFDQLEGDLAIQLRIVRAVDDPHRAGSDALDDHVTPDPRACIEIAGCHACWSCAGATVLQMSPRSEARAKGALPRRPNGRSNRYSVSAPTWRLIFPTAAMADGRISGTIQQQD